MESARHWIEWVATGIEVLAVLLMIAFIALGLARGLARLGTDANDAYVRIRLMLARCLLVGLELLVAADIIRTVAIETTFANMLGLALMVVIRTALGWSLTVEIEGRWPWQGGGKEQPPA